MSDPETDSTEEEVAPKLKYTRLSNDLQNILSSDAVSCVAVHSRFLCFGTHWGSVYFFDHQGNLVNTQFKEKNHSPTHLVSVNQISLDQKAEFIATCSDDGMVIVKEIYTDQDNEKLKIDRAIQTVAIDPLYSRSGSGRKFIVGDSKLTLYERTFLKSLKGTVLCEAEGQVSALAWHGQFVAWASAIGVRIYDLNLKCSLGLIKWEEQPGLTLTNYRCNLRWYGVANLLIGWMDTVRICVIRKPNSIEISTRNLPEYIVDPISTFQTEYLISGIAPLESNQLVILGYLKEKDLENGKACRPIVCVVEYKSCDYIELSRDCLSLCGYSELKCNDYHLDCLMEESQYFIVSPKDIVVASLYENDDRIAWFIEHSKFEEAMEMISTYGGKYSLISVARLYLDYLLLHQEFENAAKLCLRAFGNNEVLWEEEVYKFVKVQQLRTVSPYLPRTNECKLKPHIYEMVLYEYLKLDPPGFLAIIKEWKPSLYNTSAVIIAIHDHFAERDKNILLEALAILYSYERKYEKALTMYLKLQHNDVFKLIRKHDLYSVIHHMIVPLLQLDSEKAIAMLLEDSKIHPDIVVQQLEQRQDYLYLYLDAFDKVDRSGKYHAKQVNLYAKFARNKLLSFLKRSNHYPIQEALDVCKRESFYPEMVYLFGRIGNTSDALSIIIHQLKDIQMAIDFCKEHNDMDLWNELINESLDHPNIMTKLLDGIAGVINPELLVHKIKMGQEIPGLKRSLIKMFCDYSLQVSIQDGCNDILITDYFNLYEKLVNMQQKALHVSYDNTCGLCGREFIMKDPSKSDIVVFNCRHFFHATCLPDKYNTDFCRICKSKK